MTSNHEINLREWAARAKRRRLRKYIDIAIFVLPMLGGIVLVLTS